MPGAGNGAYASSKVALEAASDALRLELRSFGVAVSVIEPGAHLGALRTDEPADSRQPAGRGAPGVRGAGARVRSRTARSRKQLVTLIFGRYV